MRNKKNIRTCLGCHIKQEKTNLFRIANIKINQDNEKENRENNNAKKDKTKINNKVILDETQNMGGRGAYICSIQCLEKALEKNFLQKRLRINLSEEQKENLKQAISKAER